MATRQFLNDFEELILTMVAALADDAYGAAITVKIGKLLERKVTLSAVHVILYRLEDNGYVKSKVGGATNERGGRSKRIYTITSAGHCSSAVNERDQNGNMETRTTVKNHLVLNEITTDLGRTILKDDLSGRCIRSD